MWPRAIVAIAACIAAITFLYFESIANAVAVWSNSSAHQFSFFILPISLYFFWIRRGDLARLAPQPSLFFAFFALPLGALWLVSEAVQVGVTGQIAVVGLVQIVVIAIAGLRVYRAILFPMLFLCLMVPFGEIFLPTLIDITTTLTVTCLNILGLATQVDGNIFKSGSGVYSIVESCAALDFLLGNLVISLVFANLMYLRLRHRVLYVFASFPVAILANIFRTTSVVMITEYSNGRIDLALDHGLYGWMIFAFAVVIQMIIGLRFRDSGEQTGRAIGIEEIISGAERERSSALAVATVAVAMSIAAPAVYAMFMARSPTDVPNVSICLPTSIQQATTPVDQKEWLPVYAGSHAQINTEILSHDQNVDLFIAYYWHQGPGSEMIHWDNRVYDSENWYFLERETKNIALKDRGLKVNATRLHDEKTGRRLVWQWYWIDGQFVADPKLGKLLQAKAELLFGERRAASIAISLEEPLDGSIAEDVLQGALAHIADIENMLVTASLVTEKTTPCDLASVNSGSE